MFGFYIIFLFSSILEYVLIVSRWMTFCNVLSLNDNLCCYKKKSQFLKIKIKIQLMQVLLIIVLIDRITFQTYDVHFMMISLFH